MTRNLLTLLFWIGCARGLSPEAPAQDPASVLEMTRARPIVAAVRARLRLKLRSDALDLAGNTGGALILDRPGRGHLAVLGPLGSPLFTLNLDGLGVAATWPRDREHLVAVDAESVLRDATGGVLGLDDLLGLLVGDLPLDDARTRAKRKLEDGLVEVTLVGPSKTAVTAVLDPVRGTPVSIEATDRSGVLLIAVSYEPFELDPEVGLMPTALALTLPALELDLDLKFKRWDRLDEVPDAFGLAPPDGFRSGSLEHAVSQLLAE